jgi:hypothetical protein
MNAGKERFFHRRSETPPQSPNRRLGARPKNSQSFAEFSADFDSLRLRSGSKSNGTLLFEVLNRGKKGIISMFNRASPSADPWTAAELGDGLLMRDGYTLVWVDGSKMCRRVKN